MIKTYNKPDYKYIFDNKTGSFARWGKTLDDDPQFSKYGPEILDIEVNSICSNGCLFCYKSNTKHGKNMSVETFQRIIDVMPDTLTQVALGIGDIDANPDLWKMMTYCLPRHIVPNITINGYRMTNRFYDKLSMYCGAVAVSLYENDVCYNAVKELTDLGMKQVNIHCLLSSQTFDACMQVMQDYKEDERLELLNAIVFLWLKPKGIRNKNTQINKEQYQQLVDYALDNDINIGFDSCSAHNFLSVVKGRSNRSQLESMCEPCESTLFSYYINVDGIGFPCSFSEGNNNVQGVDVVNSNDFLRDVWFHPETIFNRTKILNNCRKCFLYDLELK